MPIYEYSCSKCGKTIEVLQKFSDKPLRKHEKCGGGLSKLISASSFHLKGTGWYKTDYAAKSAPADEAGNGKKHKEAKPESTSEKSAATESSSEPKASSGKTGKPSKSGASKK
jgi:putative FmdB family regulatory protein